MRVTRFVGPGVKGIIEMHRFNICLVVVLRWCENTISPKRKLLLPYLSPFQSWSILHGLLRRVFYFMSRVGNDRGGGKCRGGGPTDTMNLFIYLRGALLGKIIMESVKYYFEY